MEEKDNISLGLSIIIACLITVPILLLIELLIAGFFDAHVERTYELLNILPLITIITCSISIGFFAVSAAAYLAGVKSENSGLVKVGFGVGLPAWILGFVVAIMIFIVMKRIDHIITLDFYYYFSAFPDGISPYIYFRKIPIITLWLNIVMWLNIAVSVFCVIFGSIILSQSTSKYFFNYSEKYSKKNPNH